MGYAPFTGVDPHCLWLTLRLLEDLARFSETEEKELTLLEKLCGTCLQALKAREDGLQDRFVRKALYRMGIWTLLALDRREEAERTANRWEEELRRDPEAEERDHPALQRYLGKAYREAGLWEKALPLIRDSRLALEALDGKDDPGCLTALSNEALLLFRMDRDNEAVQELKELLARLEKLNGRYPYLLRQTRVMLAGISLYYDQPMAAARLMEKAWADLDLAADPDEGILYGDLETEPERLKAMLYHLYLVTTDLDQEDPEAFGAIVEEFGTFLLTEEMEEPWSGWLTAWRAYACQVRGQLAEAAERYRQVDFEELPGPGLPVCWHLQAFAECLEQLALPEEAAATWRRLADYLLEDCGGDAEMAGEYSERFGLGLAPEILEAAAKSL